MRWLLILMFLACQPAFANMPATEEEAKDWVPPHDERTCPTFAFLRAVPIKQTFRDKHPVIFHTAWPVRKLWNGCVWVGQKTEPIHPFLNLCSAAGSIATPFCARFKR